MSIKEKIAAKLKLKGKSYVYCANKSPGGYIATIAEWKRGEGFRMRDVALSLD